MRPKIKCQQRIGTYYRNDNPTRKVDMRKGVLIELRGGEKTHRPVFFFVRRGYPVVVPRHELAADWKPKHGYHVCGEQYNKQPDLFTETGDAQDTSWEAWRDSGGQS